MVIKQRTIALVAVVMSTLSLGIATLAIMVSGATAVATNAAHHLATNAASGWATVPITYTPPADLVPADISADNMVAVLSQFISNTAVLTLILVVLAVALLGGIVFAFRKIKSA